MLPATVEAANDFFPQPVLFGRISSIHHAFCQPQQLIPRQLSFRVELIGKADHAALLFRFEPFDFVDDLTCGHRSTLSRRAIAGNQPFPHLSLITAALARLSRRLLAKTFGVATPEADLLQPTPQLLRQTNGQCFSHL
jgi:hypothetical protein